MPFEFFPNTNFHDLNLDYILEKAQKIDDNLRDSLASADAAKASEEAAALSEAAAQLSEEAAAASEAAAKDYADNIADPVSGLVTDWLEDNITQETGYVIDKSLLVPDAAADSAVTGGGIYAAGYRPISNWVYGKTIFTNGDNVDVTDLQNAPSYKCAVVPCTSGDRFTINGTGSNSPRLWAFIRSDGSVIGRSGNSASAVNLILYAPDSAASLIINVNNQNDNSYIGAVDTDTDLQALAEAIGVEMIPFSRYSTIFTNGTTADITALQLASLFAHAVVDASEGDVFTVTGVASSAPRLWAFISADGSVLSRAASDANEINVQITAPAGAAKLILNADTRHTFYAFKGVSPALMIQRTPDLIMPHSVNILERVGCIGDSYTAGYIAISGAPTGDYPNYSWPHYMQSKTGNIWTNFGSSGSSTKSWIDNEGSGDHSKLAEVKAPGNKCQAYVIGLMINDSNPNGAHYVPIGTSADVGTNANSYYAYLYKLIVQVHQVNTDAPIIINTCPKTDTRYVPYNEAVRYIVQYCANLNMPVLLADLTTYSFYNDPIYTDDLVNGHYTGAGYEYMAECYYNVLSDVINHNLTMFQKIHAVDYDE